MDILCTYKIKAESQNFEYGCIKDQWPFPNWNPDANPNQEHQASSKAKWMSLSIQSDWEIKRIVKLDWINDKLIVGFYIQPKLFNLFFE